MESRVARIHEYGGPEVLKIETVTLSDPGPGEVVLRDRSPITCASMFDCFRRNQRGFGPVLSNVHLTH